MNPSAWNDRRLLVPRWRSLAATLRGRELGQPLRKALRDTDTLGENLALRLERWHLAPGLITAAELVEAALVEAREGDAVEAARRLIELDEDAAPLIKMQAAAVLARAGREHEVPPEMLHTALGSATAWRGVTRLHPRDPLAWVELAFHQTVRGHAAAAIKSMRVALNLAPENRHVLRAAGRLYLHAHDPVAAHDLLASNAATRHDPWLVSAEMAFASLADRSSRFFKLGVAMIEEGGVHPGHLTELAGSIGTAHLTDGNRKKSKRMFTASMQDPTGNALAQGEWASRQLGIEIVPQDRFASVDEAFEAIALHRYRRGQFATVPDICAKWADVDPYSVRPLEFGCTAACYVDQYELGLQLANEGLKRRVNANLLNHRAFALASLGRVSEAKQVLASMTRVEMSEKDRLIATANLGLCAFREGASEDGIALYRRTMEGFDRLSLGAASALASVYLAREAHIVRHPNAIRLLKEAEAAVKDHKGSEAETLMAHLRRTALGQEPTTSEPLTRERRLRSVTFTTPGIPGPPRRLLL